VTKYNLRRYNRRRHELLIKIPEPPKAVDTKEDTQQQRITDAMKMKTHWLTGNLEISLFWEDIFNIVVRTN